MIGVKQARLWSSQALFGQLQDLPHDVAAWREGSNFITHAQSVTRPRGLAVDAHVVGFARGLSERA